MKGKLSQCGGRVGGFTWAGFGLGSSRLDFIFDSTSRAEGVKGWRQAVLPGAAF